MYNVFCLRLSCLTSLSGYHSVPEGLQNIFCRVFVIIIVHWPSFCLFFAFLIFSKLQHSVTKVVEFGFATQQCRCFACSSTSRGQFLFVHHSRHVWRYCRLEIIGLCMNHFLRFCVRSCKSSRLACHFSAAFVSITFVFRLQYSAIWSVSSLRLGLLEATINWIMGTALRIPLFSTMRVFSTTDMTLPGSRCLDMYIACWFSHLRWQSGQSSVFSQMPVQGASEWKLLKIHTSQSRALAELMSFLIAKVFDLAKN